jgi:dTDP-4-amino-4,6-dideoxygalactose transaminase
MAKINKIIRLRRKYAELYNRLLGNCDLLTTPIVPAGYGHTYQSYVVLLAARFARDEVIRRLKHLGIESTIGTYSISSQPYFHRYRGSNVAPVPRSIKAFECSLTLPLYPSMKKGDVEKVAGALLSILKQMDEEKRT